MPKIRITAPGRLGRAAAAAIVATAVLGVSAMPAGAAVKPPSAVPAGIRIPVDNYGKPWFEVSKGPEAVGYDKMRGVFVVGATASVAVGTWKPVPAKFTYQWFSNSKPIAGATGSTYKIPQSMMNTRLGVQVTATRAGYETKVYPQLGRPIVQNTDQTLITVPQGSAAGIDAAAKAAQPSLGAASGQYVIGLRNGGVSRSYKNGDVLWSPSTGAWAVTGGDIRNAYRAHKSENGGLGYPTGNKTGGLIRGGMYQNFQGGAIVWSPQTGAKVSSGAVRGAWQRAGFEKGGLGYPTTNETPTVKGGTYQRYQGGMIYWSQATGAHTVGGAVLTAYGKAGSESGKLGFPTSGEKVSGKTVTQTFQGGKITWTAAGGAKTTYGK